MNFSDKDDELSNLYEPTNFKQDLSPEQTTNDRYKLLPTGPIPIDEIRDVVYSPPTRQTGYELLYSYA